MFAAARISKSAVSRAVVVDQADVLRDGRAQLSKISPRRSHPFANSKTTIGGLNCYGFGVLTLAARPPRIRPRTNGSVDTPLERQNVVQRGQAPIGHKLLEGRFSRNRFCESPGTQLFSFSFDHDAGAFEQNWPPHCLQSPSRGDGC
jgi:hypothetical protein